MTTTINVFESKWGFHPCSRELSKKLKKVRYYIHIDSHQQAALSRWERKLPHNRLRKVRVGTYKSLLTDKGVVIPVFEFQPWEKPQVCPINLNLLCAEYNKTLPKSSPEEVKHLSLNENQIDELINLAEEWLKSIGREKR